MEATDRERRTNLRSGRYLHHQIPEARVLARGLVFCIGLAFVAAAISPLAKALDNPAQLGILPAIIEDHPGPPAQPSIEFSRLHNTFWHLEEIQGSDTNTPGVIVSIQSAYSSGDEISITFSTPSYSVGFLLWNTPGGLDSVTVYDKRGVPKSERFSQDQQSAKIFESALHRICRYELRDEVLKLVDSGGHPIMVLSSVRQIGIENRRWRIAKYSGGDFSLIGEKGLIEAKVPGDITFLNGQIYGSPGCGGFTGTYTVSRNKVESDVGTGLGGLCSSEGFEQGQAVVGDVKGDRRIEKQGKNILLCDQGGRPVLLLVPF